MSTQGSPALCVFKYLPNSSFIYECQRCGHVECLHELIPAAQYRRVCTNQSKHRLADFKPAAEKLGVSVEEVVQWGSFVVQWVALGCLMRTDEEVAVRLAVCHEPCKECRKGRPPADPDNPPSWLARLADAAVFWRKNGYCKDCGCGVSDGKFPLFNMVRMKVPGLGCKHRKWPDAVESR